MTKKIIALVGITLAVITSCINNPAENKDNGQEKITGNDSHISTSETLLPSFSVRDANGSILNLADLKGKKVFVNIWATWCPPCMAEIPSIEKLYSKIDKEKTVFIMLSMDEDFNLAKEFAISSKMQMPVYAPAENLPGVFVTTGIPATFIFNENGELIKSNMGMEDYDTDAYLQLLKQ
jgi:thiol-disulfide isomerase/thioredoxin